MRLFRILFALLLVVLVGAVYITSLVIDDTPMVSQNAQAQPGDLRRARSRINAIYNNAEQASEAASLTVSTSELELLLAYLLNSQNGGYAKAQIEENSLSLQITSILPESFFGSFLNIKLSLIQDADMLSLSSLQLGSLIIPDWLADNMLQFGHKQLKNNAPDYALLLSAINSYRLEQGQLTINYSLKPDILSTLSDRGRELFISEATRERLQAHNTELSVFLDTLSNQRTVSLDAIITRMFSFARSRTGDPIEENRAAIIVMGLKQLDVDLNRLLQNSSQSQGILHPDFTLYRRIDSAQHFIGSAALAISTEAGMAEGIAVLKELDDSQQGGSGFSFSDLAADRAGIRFAELATADTETAAMIQLLLGSPRELEEAFFMFDFRDLPERLSEQDFKATYTDTSSDAYKEQLASIEASITQTPLFQQIVQSQQ